MPPKGKEVKRGAVAGNFKAGKALKDILPANSKPAREGQVARMEGEPEVSRSYEFEPMQMWPEWPGNDEARAHDFTAGFEQDENGQWQKFTEPDGEASLHLPPSFQDFTKGQPAFLRPEEYIREIAYEKEIERRRQEKKREQRLRKASRKSSMLSMSGAASPEEIAAQQKQDTELELLNKTKSTINKVDLVIHPQVIRFDERLETEAEVQKRKEAAERAAATDKNPKKKAAPAKGAPATDPADEPQTLRVPIDGSLDMSFLMPKYTKWVTSQLQCIRDRAIRDVDSSEAIWQRIYPQENGIPTISPTGKYWVKLRFMGKERLVEIDDRMPCSAKGMPILPRTTEAEEIWPQLLVKALLKVYSYKWYSANCQYDSETGDGSIVYSLTGLVPEKIALTSAAQAQELFKRYLSDEHYFGKKSYLTCFCDNEFRPKFPSQAKHLSGVNLSSVAGGLGGQRPGDSPTTVRGPTDASVISETMSTETAARSSSKMMLGKLKDAASLAISVTTGRKPAFGAKEKSLTNIIPGFGYALMDVFENEFVDMESIAKQNTQIVEECASPFISPAKSRGKRDKSLGKDEYKRQKREQRKKEQEERERKEKEPPTQYAFVKIKTSIGKHPVVNYLSTFTNDEITEGKKHYLNRWRRDPSKPAVLPYRPASPSKRGAGEHGRFSLTINQAPSQDATKDGQGLETSQMSGGGGQTSAPEKPVLLPKPRAPGGIWITQSDFPFAFQHIIVYHNMKKYNHSKIFQDIWDNAAEPYISNEKEVYIKMELDPEAAEKVKQEEQMYKNIGVIGHGLTPDNSLSQLPEHEESKNEAEESQAEATKRSQDKVPLPGEVQKPKPQHDTIIIACAPYPTNKPHEVLCRYLTNIQQVDCEMAGAKEEDKLIKHNFKSYFEGVTFNVLDEMSTQNCIWLKPEFNSPQGATLWFASHLRKVSIVSKSEYLQEQKQYFSKQVVSDYLPLQAGKYQLFGKYEFAIPEKDGEDDVDTVVNIKVDCPADKFLLDYMRVKIIDRRSDAKYKTETENVVIVNTMNLSDLKLKPNDGAGYWLIIEGVMPYNTTEGQIVIDTLCNKDSFALQEVVQCEPLEYSDAYVPIKYGVIFKEKIVVSPTDHTSATMNIRLLKGGEEFDKIEGLAPKMFRVDILDNGKPIFSQTGFNQITLSHFMFRCNQGLPEKPEAKEGESGEEAENSVAEVKHNYVIQAHFDLHEWPAGKTLNDESADITWQIKLYSSETIALIKDTDKEDREKALKASWEAEEPGRAEKAKLSRQKFLLKQKLKQGEQLTEEELEIVQEKRERVRKRDQDDAAAKGPKGGKAPPPKGKAAPPKAGTTPAPEEDEETSARQFPIAQDHSNCEIKDFLEHFSSSRKIAVSPPAGAQPRERNTSEKEKILQDFNSEMTAESESFQQISDEREKLKEMRQAERDEAFKDMDESRDQFKTVVNEIMDDRNKYRDMIENRKEKEVALLELIKQDKADINAVKTAIQQAEEATVLPKYIKQGKKYLELMEYIKEFEGLIQSAVADKNKDTLQALLERVDHESALMGNPLAIDAKVLNDAKNNLTKMK